MLEADTEDVPIRLPSADDKLPSTELPVEESLLEEVVLLTVLFSLFNKDWAEAFVAKSMHMHTKVAFKTDFLIL